MSSVDPAEALDRLRITLAQALRLVQDVPDAEPPQTVDGVEAALDRLSAMVEIWRMQRPAPTEAFWSWLHDARSLVNAMVGWARMLRILDSESKRAHARATIERNAARLEQLLGSPPV